MSVARPRSYRPNPDASRRKRQTITAHVLFRTLRTIARNCPAWGPGGSTIDTLFSCISRVGASHALLGFALLGCGFLLGG